MATSRCGMWLMADSAQPPRLLRAQESLRSATPCLRRHIKVVCVRVCHNTPVRRGLYLQYFAYCLLHPTWCIVCVGTSRFFFYLDLSFALEMSQVRRGHRQGAVAPGPGTHLPCEVLSRATVASALPSMVNGFSSSFGIRTLKVLLTVHP